jgi:hypothetical protein
MKQLKILLLLLTLSVVLSGCSQSSGSKNLVYAGWNDIFAIDIETGRIAAEIPVESKINDLEPTKSGKLLAATAKGLVIVDTAVMEVEKIIPLGILDSVEHDGQRDLTYVMLHPGDDPHESKGPHKLIKLSGSDYSELGSITLEPWIYDTYLSPSGSHIYITQMAGRNVLRVSTDDFDKPEKIWFGEGGMWEGRMILLRHIAFSGDGSNMYILEQSEVDSTCIWNYSPETGEKKRTCLESAAMVQGMVTSTDGSRIFANGINELIILSSGGEEIIRTELDLEHRWITLSPDGKTLCLTAATGTEEGFVTCVDTSGKVIKEIKLSTPLNVIVADKG